MSKKTFCTLFFLLIFFIKSATANENSSTQSNDDPCAGNNALLALLNRPSVLDSACAVKMEKLLLEMGYQYTYLSGCTYGDNFPQAIMRVGLPEETEFDFLFPNFVHQTPSGFTSLAIGLKRELSYSKNFVWSIEGFLIPPTGSAAYGSAGLGGYTNLLIGYNITKKISISLGLGLSTIVQSEQADGLRYTSFNPDILLAWQPLSKWQLYAELFAQTRTSPTDGFGAMTDVGIQYLITQNFEVDAEAGARLYGNLAGFNYYVGVGLGILI